MTLSLTISCQTCQQYPLRPSQQRNPTRIPIFLVSSTKMPGYSPLPGSYQRTGYLASATPSVFPRIPVNEKSMFDVLYRIALRSELVPFLPDLFFHLFHLSKVSNISTALLPHANTTAPIQNIKRKISPNTYYTTTQSQIKCFLIIPSNHNQCY